MYKILKHFGDNRHAFLLKAQYSCTVNIIFDKKQHVLLFIDIVCDLLSKQTLHINKSQSKLVVNIQNVFHTKQIKNVKPFLEISQYVTMLNVDNFDWKALKDKLSPLIHDDDISTPAFYCFLDEALSLAIRNEMSIDVAVSDTHLLQRLKFLASTRTFENNWFSMVLPAYNHADYVKYKNQLAKAGEQIVANPIQTGNNINQFANGQLGNNKRPRPRNTRPQNQPNEDANNRGVSGKVREWCNMMKTKLNKKYVKILPNHCALWNMKNAKCNKANKAYCWMYNGMRSHSCLCGDTNHRAWQCKVIFNNNNNKS